MADVGNEELGNTDDSINDDIDNPSLADHELQLEAEARDMGWVPQNEFRGKTDKWVDASTYLERGKTFVPFLRKNNEKLEREIASMKQEKLNSEARLRALEQASIDARNAAVARAEKDLRASLREARRDGDIDKQEELEEALEQVKEHKKTIETQPAQPQQTGQPHPDYADWVEKNDWYLVDTAKREFADKYAQQLQNSGQQLDVKQFLRMVSNKVNSHFNNAAPVDRVSSGKPSRSSGGSGRTYADLDADAKAACDAQASEFVGTGDFKTKKDYQEFYAKIYFGSNQ